MFWNFVATYWACWCCMAFYSALFNSFSVHFCFTLFHIRSLGFCVLVFFFCFRSFVAIYLDWLSANDVWFYAGCCDASMLRLWMMPLHSQWKDGNLCILNNLVGLGFMNECTALNIKTQCAAECAVLRCFADCSYERNIWSAFGSWSS